VLLLAFSLGFPSEEAPNHAATLNLIFFPLCGFVVLDAFSYGDGTALRKVLALVFRISINPPVFGCGRPVLSFVLNLGLLPWASFPFHRGFASRNRERASGPAPAHALPSSFCNSSVPSKLSPTGRQSFPWWLLWFFRRAPFSPSLPECCAIEPTVFSARKHRLPGSSSLPVFVRV